MRAAPNRQNLRGNMDLLLQLLGGAALLAVSVLAVILIDYFQTERCPYCARGWAIFKRGEDLVCRRCAGDIDRRIRATADDPVPPRPRIVK